MSSARPWNARLSVPFRQDALRMKTAGSLAWLLILFCLSSATFSAGWKTQQAGSGVAVEVSGGPLSKPTAGAIATFASQANPSSAEGALRAVLKLMRMLTLIAVPVVVPVIVVTWLFYRAAARRQKARN